MPKSIINVSLDDYLVIWLKSKPTRSGFLNFILKKQYDLEKQKYNSIEDIDSAIEILKNKKNQFLIDFDKDIQALEVYKESFKNAEKKQ